MSVRVTVQPIGSNVLLKDVEAAKKDEWTRRRKLRLTQVRQQSKDAASRVRQRVTTEKENKRMAEDKLHDQLLREWQMKKIESLERQYKQCLEEVKQAQQRALQEKEMEALMKERRERLTKLADHRGRQAMDAIRQEKYDQELEKMKADKAKHFKKTVEDLRSSLVSTLPHPSKTQRNSPIKKSKKVCGEKSASKKENELLKTVRGYFQKEEKVVSNLNNESASKTDKENEWPSFSKKKRVISSRRESEVDSIISRKTWPPRTTIVTKKPTLSSSPRKFRRVIHSFNRGCVAEDPATSFRMAQTKHHQVNAAARQLKEQVRKVPPETGISHDINRLVENLSSLAEEEKFIRSQLLCQMQRRSPGTHSETELAETGKQNAASSNFINTVDQILDQTLTDCTQMDHTADRSVLKESHAKSKESTRRKTYHRTTATTPRSTEKKPTEEDIFCNACRKYLKHACAEHSSTTVTESVSNSSSLTFMSVSKSTIETNDSSSATVEGVKVIVSVHGQKNMVKSVKIGKPIHSKKKRKGAKKPDNSEKSKPSRGGSRSGSVTSYLSPPDRVSTDESKIIQRILREMAKNKKAFNVERFARMLLSNVQDSAQAESSEAYSEASSNSDQSQFSSPLFKNEQVSIRSKGTVDISDGESQRSPSPEKVDKTCQTLTICDKVVQTSQNSATLEASNKTLTSEQVDENSNLTSGKHSFNNASNIAETEKLINYYCNVADKYTNSINHLINVLNRSSSIAQDSLNSSSTSHMSPPFAFNDSIHLSESMKQLAPLSKSQSFQPSKASSPIKSQPQKKSTLLEKLAQSFRISPKEDSTPQSSQKSPPAPPPTQQQQKYHSSALCDEEGNLIYPSAARQILESTGGSSADKDRPFGNYTLDISSLTSEEENGGRGPADFTHSSLDSNEKALFRKQQGMNGAQQNKFNNNRVITVPQDLSTILEVDTPSTTHHAVSQDALGISTSKRTLQTSLQKSPDVSTRDIIMKNQALLQSKIDALQEQIEILNRSQKDCSPNTSQGSKSPLDMSLQESWPNRASKRHEKSSSVKTKSPSRRSPSPSNGSPNNHNTSTESEIPDIVEEMIKRGLISSPFPWMKDLQEKLSCKDDSPTNRKRTSSTDSDSTQLINEELENILRNDLSPEDLNKVFKNLGSSWAVSTWKKIAETSHFNSPSSSDSSLAGKKPDPSDSRSHPKHSTPIKHKKKHHSERVSSPSQSNDVSPENVFLKDLDCGISSVNNSVSDVYDLTPPDVALHRPQLLKRDNNFKRK